MQPTDDFNAGCGCGGAQFRIEGTPLMRLFCHCTLCQAFNQAPYADITVFRGKDVVMPAPETVRYQTLRPPPAVQRGACSQCGKPAVEFMHLGPLPKFVFVPTANLRDPTQVPEPSLHMFYNRRVADINDDLPKVSGYLKSQVASVRMLIGALMRRR